MTIQTLTVLLIAVALVLIILPCFYRPMLAFSMIGLAMIVAFAGMTWLLYTCATLD